METNTPTEASLAIAYGSCTNPEHMPMRAKCMRCHDLALAIDEAVREAELKGAREAKATAWDVARDSVMRLDEVACFICKAKPGEPCWDTVRNGPASGTHLTRIADSLKRFRDEDLAEIANAQANPEQEKSD